MFKDVPSWALYPQSLSPSICDPYTYDLVQYGRLLEENSSRLFVAEEEMRIKIIEVGLQGGQQPLGALDRLLTPSRVDNQHPRTTRKLLGFVAIQWLAHHVGCNNQMSINDED